MSNVNAFGRPPGTQGVEKRRPGRPRKTSPPRPSTLAVRKLPNQSLLDFPSLPRAVASADVHTGVDDREGENAPGSLAPSRTDAGGALTVHPARGIQPIRRYNEERRKIAQLRAEIASLQEDLTFATRETDRIYHEFIGKGPTTPPDPERLVAFLLKYLVAAEPDPEPAPIANQLVSAALNPMRWLPFGQNALNLSSMTIVAKPTPAAEAEPEPVSHHPVAMSAVEELPYLQLFTTLRFSSRILLLPRASPTAPLLQRYYFYVASAFHPALFSARMEMTVDTHQLNLVQLRIPRIEASARPELEPFLHRILYDAKSSSAMFNNITMVTWAMNEWCRLAVVRAQAWFQLRYELSTVDSILDVVQRTRSTALGRKSTAAPPPDFTSIIRPSDILALVGKTVLELPLAFSRAVGPAPKVASDRSEVTLRVEWTIEFDWTGDAHSVFKLTTALPGKWHRQDERKSLRNIPRVFRDMVGGREKKLVPAVHTIVALLAGEE